MWIPLTINDIHMSMRVTITILINTYKLRIPVRSLSIRSNYTLYFIIKSLIFK